MIKSDLKILGIIPARCGSKGVLKKNIKLLNNKPLIQYTIEHAQKSQLLTRLIVSTECNKIKNICHNVEVLLRPWELAQDHIPVIPDVLQSVVNQIDYLPNICVILEPTYPFRTHNTIDRTIRQLLRNKADWIATISKVKDHPFRMRTTTTTGILKPLINDPRLFNQRQDLPPVFMVRGAVYCTWTKNINKSQDCETKWQGVLIDEKESIDIDESIDWLVAEQIAKGAFL